MSSHSSRNKRKKNDILEPPNAYSMHGSREQQGGSSIFHTFITSSPTFDLVTSIHVLFTYRSHSPFFFCFLVGPGVVIPFESIEARFSAREKGPPDAINPGTCNLDTDTSFFYFAKD